MIEKRNKIVRLFNTVPPVTAGTASVIVFQALTVVWIWMKPVWLNLILVPTGCLTLLRGVTVLEGRSIRSHCRSNPEPLQASALSSKVMWDFSILGWKPWQFRRGFRRGSSVLTQRWQHLSDGVTGDSSHSTVWPCNVLPHVSQRCQCKRAVGDAISLSTECGQVLLCTASAED